MDFMKYPSIENSYRSNFIEKWVSRFPELLIETYVLTEKIHGANFSVMITKDNIEFGKRTSKLEAHESFFDWQNVVSKYGEQFKTLQNFISKGDHDSIRIFGEIFGSNIQKGVYYGDKKQIKFYDAFLNDVLMSQVDFMSLFEDLGIGHMLVPIIAIVESLEEALSYDIKFNSNLIDIEDNICEGVVIKPFDKVYQWGEEDGYFYLKYKNTEFTEKQKDKKVKVDFTPTEEYQEAINVYASYINENRLDSVFSKHGRIEEMNQIGDYIRYMLHDAREDYLKDNMEQFLKLNDIEKKQLFGLTGKLLVPMLKESM